MAHGLLTTHAVADLLGVSPSTIKRWTDERVVGCVKTRGGHRRFRPEDVELMRAHAAADPHEAAQWIELLLRDEEPYSAAARLLLARARHGSWSGVADELGAVLEEVGRRWERRELSVLQEHVISERLERALGWCAQAIPVGPVGPRALLLTATGDDHTLGLSLLELCLREAGWAARWSGRGTPTADVASHLRDDPVELIAVSASCGSADTHVLRAQLDELTAVAQPLRIPILLGGRGAWPSQAGYAQRVMRMDELAAALDRVDVPFAA